MCVSMGVGILVCLIALIGYLAAETVNGCCLCFVSFKLMIMISVCNSNFQIVFPISI